MKKNVTISFIVGLAISAVALYFAFKNIPVRELGRYLGSINYLWMIPAVAVTLISFFLRAVRWRLILESVRKIGIWQAYHPMIIGFMINCVLPGRLGEAARPAILQKEEKIAFTTGLATVAAERAFDIFFLIILFLITAGTIKINPDLNVAFGNHQLNRETLVLVFNGLVKIGAVLIAGILLFSIEKFRAFIYRVIRLTPRLVFFAGHGFQTTFGKRICEPVIGILENIAQGFALVKYPRKVFFCALLSSLIWSLQALSYYLVSLGCPGINLGYFEIATVMVVICFVISLPSVPGWWGLWEAGGVFALSIFGVASKQAAGYTLVNHALQVIPVIVAGLASAILLSVNIRRISYKADGS
jgi:uncharacterized protein (TIRG00374 family)